MHSSMVRYCDMSDLFGVNEMKIVTYTVLVIECEFDESLYTITFLAGKHGVVSDHAGCVFIRDEDQLDYGAAHESRSAGER